MPLESVTAMIVCSAVLSILTQAQITFISQLPLYHKIQGSLQGRFLLCAKCRTVLGVSYIDDGFALDSLNARPLDEFDNLQSSVNISPKTLDKTAKINDGVHCGLKCW